MMIWSHTASPPQHIGNADGGETLAELLAGAQRARHTTMRYAIRAECGNDVVIHMFDTLPRVRAWVASNRDVTIGKIATTLFQAAL